MMIDDPAVTALQESVHRLESKLERVHQDYRARPFAPTDFILSNTPPRNPVPGSMYWDSANDRIRVFHPTGWEDYYESDGHTHDNEAELDLITDGDHDVREDNPHSVDEGDVLPSQVGKDGNWLTTDAGSAKWDIPDHKDLTSIGTNEHTDIDDHIGSTSNPHSVTKAQVGLTDVPDLDTTDAVNNEHAESHSVASHSDTSATGSELNELTDGSTTVLHAHAGGGGGSALIYIKATGQAEGDLHLSDGSNWDTDKSVIKAVRVITTSTDWELWLLQNDNGYATDDATIPMIQLIGGASGDVDLFPDLSYEDEDASGEVHVYYQSASGSETADIIIQGHTLE